MVQAFVQILYLHVVVHNILDMKNRCLTRHLPGDRQVLDRTWPSGLRFDVPWREYGARCQATGFQWLAPLEIKSFGMTDLSIERKSATNPDDFIYTQGDIGTLELEYPG